MYRRKIAYLFAYRNGIRAQSVGVLRQFGEEEAPEVMLELLHLPERKERWSIYYFNERENLSEASYLWEADGGQTTNEIAVGRYRLCAEAGSGKGVVLLPEHVGSTRTTGIEWPNTDCYLCGRYDGREVTEAQIRAAFTHTGIRFSAETVSSAKRLVEEITKAAGGEGIAEEEGRYSLEKVEKKEKSITLKRKAEQNRVACLEELLLTKPAYRPCRESSLLYSVRVSPEELSLLPKEGRVFAENSFLLHGYYRYRHLLLGRRRWREQDEYVLLVPGTYFKRDISLAGMFGFREFLPAQYGMTQAAAARGIFGYWCAKM